MRYQKCPYNNNLKCWEPGKELSCPKLDEEWIEIVDRWALDRGVSCCDWTTINGSKITYDDEAVKKCNVGQCFDEPGAVLNWEHSYSDVENPHSIDFTIDICKDLIRGRMIWSAVNMGFTRKSEIKRLKKRYPSLFS